MQNFDFQIPTKIVFGGNRISELHQQIEPAIERILIVTDKSAGKKSGALSAIFPQMESKTVVLFNDVEENPSLETVEKGVRLARENDVELVIGLGGGSPMDAAKGIALLVTNDKPMQDYLGGEMPEHGPLPIICVPTTSGTGSEVTPFAVFTNSETQSKEGYSHPGLYPIASIVDPELTYSMPETVIVNTGMDVLTHAIEAYLSALAFPLNDLFAVSAIETVLGHLESASKKDTQSMGAMAYASMLAGVSIAHASTILLHILAYPLTVFHGIPHGKANAVLLPAFMRFMRENSTVKAKVNYIDKLFEKLNGIEAFLAKFGITTSLSDYGIKNDEFEKFASKVICKGDVAITPAEITEDIIVTIYRSTE